MIDVLRGGIADSLACEMLMLSNQTLPLPPISIEGSVVLIRVSTNSSRGHRDGGDGDLDLLVVLNSFDPLHSIALKIEAAAASAIPAPYDVVFTDTSRFAVQSNFVGTIERAAVRTGRRVYAR